MPKFARTLERIRDDPDSFYTGSLAQDIVKDIRDGGGIITLEDLKNYKTEVRTPLSAKMGNYTWYTNPPPGSGAVLSLILNILKGKTDFWKLFRKFRPPVDLFYLLIHQHHPFLGLNLTPLPPPPLPFTYSASISSRATETNIPDR